VPLLHLLTNTTEKATYTTDDEPESRMKVKIPPVGYATSDAVKLIGRFGSTIFIPEIT
jgi:hypothetical protein